MPTGNWWEDIFLPSGGSIAKGAIKTKVGSVAPNAFNPVPTPSSHGGNTPRPTTPVPVKNYGSADTLERKIMGNSSGPKNIPKNNPPGGGSLGNGSSYSDPGYSSPDHSGLEALFAMLDADTVNTKTNNKALYDAALAKIVGDYGEGSTDRFQQYTNSRDILTGQAANLGVNYDETKMGQDYDVDLRQIQETSDENLNIDKAWFEKMGVIDANSLETMRLGLKMELANRKTQAEAAAASAYLNSRNGSRGGRRNSNDGTAKDKATDTYTQEDPEYSMLYNELNRTNPRAAALMDSAYWSNTSTDTAIPVLVNAKPQAASFYGRFPANQAKSVGQARANRANSVTAHAQAIAALQSMSARGSNIAHTRKVTE